MLAAIGAFFVILWIAGTLGIGNFRFYYGAKEKEIVEVPMTQAQIDAERKNTIEGARK
jgi:hypothetical protein